MISQLNDFDPDPFPVVSLDALPLSSQVKELLPAKLSAMNPKLHFILVAIPAVICHSWVFIYKNASGSFIKHLICMWHFYNRTIPIQSISRPKWRNSKICPESYLKVGKLAVARDEKHSVLTHDLLQVCDLTPQARVYLVKAMISGSMSETYRTIDFGGFIYLYICEDIVSGLISWQW